VPLLILSLASSKLGLYALPIFPALALATSHLWVRKMRWPLTLLAKKDVRAFARDTALVACWVVALLSAKLALAHYPIRKDARALWAQIQEHIPEGGYEVVTIDERVDGLLFYGAEEVENVTKKQNPYPTFVMPEHILQELKDIPTDNHTFLFLVREADDIREVRRILTDEQVDYQELRLPYERALYVCRPP
jgi:4-amino-4-deoxy-L-arabinose transferase